ncbi:MAG: response regulator, partial [Candidatus Muiribacteriota bacterium]
MKILIVDDCEIQRSIIMEMLKSNKMNISTFSEAENGEKALKIIEKIDFDFIITDIQMPCMDGVCLLREIIKRKIAHKTKIIIMSAEIESFNFTDTEREKIFKIIKKPFS